MALNSPEYRTLQHHTTDLCLAVKQNLTSLSGALFADKLITQGSSDDLRNPMHSIEDRAAKLVGLVQDKVQQDSQNYGTFIKVLQKDLSQYGGILSSLKDTYHGFRRQLHHSNSSSSAGGSFEQEQSPDYQQQRSRLSSTASRPSFERETSLDYQQQRSRLSSTASRPSFEHEASLDECRRENDSDEDTQSMIQINLDAIRGHFASLIERLRAAFDGIDVTQVHQYLTDTLQCLIPQSSDLQKIFNYLSSQGFWSYQNHGLVEMLNKHFLQNDRSIKQHITDYKRTLAGYFTAKKIIKSEFFIDSTLSESTTQSVTEYSHEHRKVLSMKLNIGRRKISDECLKYVADLWESLAEEFELPSLTAVIDSIVEKCLEISWLILPKDAEKITLALAADHSDFFEKNAITLVTIDDDIIYEKILHVVPVDSLSLLPMPTETPDPCLNYTLFGDCSFGARCRYQHTRSISSPVTVYIEAKYLKHSPTRYFGYKERNPSSHKGFVILQSNREPAREVKVVAEDHETAEYAKSRLPAIIPDKKKSVKRECAEKKLFGKCRNKSCTYKHGGVKRVERPKIGYFCHPMGLWSFLKSIVGFIEYSNDDEVYKVVQSDRDPNREVKVIAESEEALEYAKRRLTVIVGRKYAERYIMLCYIHPEDLKELSCFVKFHKQPNKDQEYTIAKVQSDVSVGAAKSCDETFLASLCDRDQYSKSVSELLNDPQSIPSSFSTQMRFSYDFLDAIHDKLQYALEWIDKKHLQLKLRGRFGKLAFSKVDRKFCDAEGCDATEMIKYLFENKSHKRFFNIKLSQESSSALVTRSLADAGSMTETYELKLGIGNRDRLEVHLKFPGGRLEPEVVQLKKDDSRILTVDVMCLNQEYDMRLDLSSFNIISADNPMIHNFLSTVTMTSQDTISLVPLGPDSEWTMTVLRQKIRRAYYLKDSETNKYLVTICSVREYKTKERDLKPSDAIEVNMGDIREETEIEFHNLYWDVHVGSQFGQSPMESLALLLEPDKIPAELKSLPFTDGCSTEMIMKDFAREKFLQTMYELNKSLHTS